MSDSIIYDFEYSEDTIIRRLGKGGQATVYLVDIEGEDVVVKIIDKKTVKKRRNRNRLIFEIKLLRRLREEYGCGKSPTVCFRGFLEDDNNVYIFMKHLPTYDTLNKVAEIIRESDVDESIKRMIFNKIASGLLHGIEEIHSLGVLHKDIKPSNILVTMDVIEKILSSGSIDLIDEIDVKYIDFGMACSLEEKKDCHELRGSVYYIPPELTIPQEIPILESIDLFCIGATMYSAITGGTWSDHLIRWNFNIKQMVKRIASILDFSRYERIVYPEGYRWMGLLMVPLDDKYIDVECAQIVVDSQISYDTASLLGDVDLGESPQNQIIYPPKTTHRPAGRIL